jgi:alanyl-tRNA synthetase
MKSTELKKEFIEFFKSKKHKEIVNSSLVPQNDPTVLFTTAGMHPIVPYLLGQKHPLGKRLVNCQKCIRTGDIDEVGDNVHLTLFQMLGNWSLGDYWKEEAITWSFEFLTKNLGFPIERLAVSVFGGDENSKKDEESAKIWLSLGIPKERIAYLGKKNNWWGPAGQTGPCGPDTEMFYWSSSEKAPKKFDSNDNRWVEVWNDVFMEFNKEKDGKYSILKQRNVDTGFGYERVYAILEGVESVYDSSLFRNSVDKIKSLSSSYDERSIRIIADHLRAAVFLLAENVKPSNLEQGYVLRRLIRRAIRYGKLIGIKDNFTSNVARIIIDDYKREYPSLFINKQDIIDSLDFEEEKFGKTILSGLRLFERLCKKDINGKDAFLLFQSYGFPIEMTVELAKENKIEVDVSGFEKELAKHQELSRTAAKGKFASGLADHSEQTIKLHTASHLVHAALEQVLGCEIIQKGSNITPERLRFDFGFPRKLTNEEISEVERLVNNRIREGLKVVKEEMSVSEAKKKGAKGVFDHKYGDKISVYNIGDFSSEICSGPHVTNTKELGKFKIVKEETSSAGVRRIRATVE